MRLVSNAHYTMQWLDSPAFRFHRAQGVGRQLINIKIFSISADGLPANMRCRYAQVEFTTNLDYPQGKGVVKGPKVSTSSAT